MIIVILLCSITLILFQTSALLNNFLTKIKTIYLVDSNNFFDFIVIMFIQFILVHVLLIRQNGDIEMNPWTKTNSSHSFSICHWDLNSLTAHNHLKVSLLRVLLWNLMLNVCQWPLVSEIHTSSLLSVNLCTNNRIVPLR